VAALSNDLCGMGIRPGLMGPLGAQQEQQPEHHLTEEKQLPIGTPLSRAAFLAHETKGTNFVPGLVKQ